ncbi:hypothetical protein OG884_06280 [Streptosporangium sp. NBC_01755]|uniref:hypothetical protein n=1 Tax=Streptosporangium sp. NBC_01755 TaxID=2975949 RepID=UPI002DDA2A64|nr:hypothetical protein [Streptosporangium sp. NBC_01755]WSD01535.1 hypothetical protein OG884_06280 [Streptosporangium sp. NBC_01755]
MSADVHGVERASLEPEIGVIEIDPATGEIPVVVINSEQSHRKAMQAIKAWRERLVLPTPFLTILDLAKEYPFGAAVSAGTAAVVAAASVSVAANLLPGRPPPAVTINERVETIQTSSVVTPFTTAGKPSASAAPTRRRPAVLLPTPRPAASSSMTPSPSMPPSPTLISTPKPEPSSQSSRPQAAAPPSGKERPNPVENGEPPSAEPSPQKPTLLPPIDIDVPLVDEDPLVDAVCGLLPIGHPIG